MIYILDSRDIAETIKSMALKSVENSKPMSVLFGTVTSENPLTITAEQKLILSEKQLILSRNVTDFKTELSFDNPLIYQEAQVKELSIKGNTMEKNHVSKRDFIQHTAEILLKFTHRNKVRHNITVYNSLKNEEKVILLRLNGGEKYLVLDRVV